MSENQNLNFVGRFSPLCFLRLMGINKTIPIKTPRSETREASLKK
jgi:hypothetical protein